MRNGEMGSVVDDIWKVLNPIVEDTVDQGRGIVSDNGATLVDQMIRSTAFKQVLVKVESAAENAVTKKVAENAVNLGAIALAMGVAGGVVSKSRAGQAIGLALGIYGVMQLAQSGGTK